MHRWGKVEIFHRVAASLFTEEGDLRLRRADGRNVLALLHARFDELVYVRVAQPPSAGPVPEHSGGPLCHTG
jgi:hypothetical protein